MNINVCPFISDVMYGPSIIKEKESDAETTGFTDDNQSWLKPVTKKKQKQVLGSDGEEQKSDSEGSIVGEEQQSVSEGSVGSEGSQSDQEQMSSDEDENYRVRKL